MKRVCVFCASSPGGDPRFAEATRELGRLLAAEQVGVVYGGGNVGLMGALADAVLDAGGEVIGIIPRALLERELGHARLSALHVVESMHQRKHLMHALSDGFLALPGGFGTLEELVETLTWGQLGMHGKPCGLVNVAGYYDALLAFFDQAVEARLLRPEHRALLLCIDSPAAALSALRAFESAPLPKWIDRDQT